MKNKATLSLIEQVIMILVFAVSAAISLRIFAYGESLSKEKANMDKAVLMAQNAAETITAVSGDFDAAAEMLGAERTENGFEQLQEDEESAFQLKVERNESSNPLLGEAGITVCSEGKELYTLRICWQEAEK